MKNLLLVIALLFTVNAFSQSLDSLNKKYELQQQILERTAYNMDRHWKQYSTGIGVQFVGAAIAVVSAILIKDDKLVYGLGAGALIATTGMVISIDSHKFFGRKYNQ